MSRPEPSPGLDVVGRGGRALLAKERRMSALLIARFDGDVEELTRSYDRAHALIMSRGSACLAPNGWNSGQERAGLAPKVRNKEGPLRTICLS